jgi:RNA-binding protein YhbY
MDSYVEKNRIILNNAITKIGKKRLAFEEHEIEDLAKSKQFNMIDYLKKVMIADEFLKLDENLSMEHEMKQEFEKLLVERNEFEENNNLENKRYKNIKAKTDYGFAFFAMQSYFTPKTLNKIANDNPDIVYKVDNEIDRRSRKSRYFKTDRDRAESNAIVNMFREKFPKSKDTLSKNTLCIDSEGMTVSNVAARTIGKLCESGVLSDFVLKVSTRIDMFAEETGIKKGVNNVFKNVSNVMKYAASAAVIAFVGAEALELATTPMPPIADLGIKETIELFASNSLNHSQDVGIIPNNNVSIIDSPVQVNTINVESLNIGQNGLSESQIQDIDTQLAENKVDPVQLEASNEVVVDEIEHDQAILDFINEHKTDVEITNGQTLTEIAYNQLENPTAEEVQHYISAMSEFNDIDNPNMILEGEDIQIPTDKFVENFENPTFNIDLSNKNSIMEQMKNVEIHYGETKSELIEKLVEGAKETGKFKNAQLEQFSSQLNQVIPTDLKAYDSTVTSNISDMVSELEKLANKSKLKFR